MAFSPAGGRLAIATSTTLDLWNTETWEREAVLDGDHGARSLSFSGDGAVLAVGGTYPTENIALWSMTSLTVIATLTDSSEPRGSGPSVSLSADGSALASSARGGTVKLWDVRSRTLLGIVEGGSGMSLSPDGSLLALPGERDVVRVWDVAIGADMAAMDGRPSDGGPAAPVAFSPDGTRLASLHPMPSRDVVRVWDMASGREVITLTDGVSRYEILAFAPDGAVLATAGFDRIVRLGDIASGQVVTRLQSHDRGVRALAFSPDGSMLASADGGVVLVWDVATGSVRTTPAVGRPVTASPR